MYHCSSCTRTFSETSRTPLAQLKTPIALVVQVLAALTEGVGINAATRLYGVSKNSIYRWQERLSGLKKHSCCLP
jgi:transposase-like protein